MDILNWYKKLAHQSYNDNDGSRKQNVGDYKLVGGSRHNAIYQNQKTGEIVQSISGSRSISDFISDGLLGTLGVKDNHYRKRQEESEEIANRISRIRGNNSHTITGHSLGSNLGNNLINNNIGDKAVNFNPYVTHHDFKQAKHDKITNVRNAGDIASVMTRHNKNTVNLDTDDNSYTNISNHSLNNIHLQK
jgi:hypothetical protein